VWLYRMRAVDLRSVASSMLLPAASVAASFLGMEALRSLLGLSRETLGGGILYGAIFCLVYVVLLRLTSRQQCREVVRFLPGGTHLQRWLLLGA